MGKKKELIEQQRKDRELRITRQRRELRRLNLAYLAQYGRATRLAREINSLILSNRAIEKERNGLMGEVGKYDLAVAHGRQALKPKARAKFDAEYNRIMKGENDEQN